MAKSLNPMPKTTKPDKPLVAVFWDDAHGRSPSWHEELGSEDIVHQPMPIVTVGWLLKDDGMGVSVANELIQCQCLIGNSSVGIRECSYLGVPVVDIGSRQWGRAKAMNVVHAQYNALDIDLAVRRQIRNGRYRQSDLYGDGEAGLKIAALLATTALRVEKRIAY